jgi:hypothetical protein
MRSGTRWHQLKNDIIGTKELASVDTAKRGVAHSYLMLKKSSYDDEAMSK